MKNAHGRTCKKTKVSMYLYISLYENLFENGCIYIYIYIYIYNIYGSVVVWSPFTTRDINIVLAVKGNKMIKINKRRNALY